VDLELPSGGTLRLTPFLHPPEATRLKARLVADLTWEQRAISLFGREVLQPRLIAWAGGLPYRYSGQTLEPRPMLPVLLELTERVSARAGVEMNHVLVNRYRDGRDSMGYHADDEPELGRDPTVVTLSLGVARRFVLRSRVDKREPPLALTLEHGALLILAGPCQHRYRHAVPRQPSLSGERISLTFRRLLRAPTP
jgi:alkylated DNA repair dioxygenase AlkB